MPRVVVLRDSKLKPSYRYAGLGRKKLVQYVNDFFIFGTYKSGFVDTFEFFYALGSVVLSGHFLLRSGRRMIVNGGFLAEKFGRLLFSYAA